MSLLNQDEYKRYLAQKLNIRENLVKISSIKQRVYEPNLTKIDIAELCIIKSILEKPKRLDSVLDIVDSSMFEVHKNEFELLLTDIENISLNAIILNEKDALVEGYLFSTEKLAENWQMLDDFEGFQYKRVQVKTFLDSGEIVQAWTYVMNEQI